MRKFTKIFLSVSSSVILALIALLITAWLLMMLPPVQNAVARAVARSVSRSLNTTVSFDKVELKLINKLAFEGFYIEDHAGDTLLFADRLYVTMSSRALVRGDLIFKTAGIKGGIFNIKPDSTGVSNLSRFLGATETGDDNSSSGKPLHLAARRLDVEGINLRIKSAASKETKGIFNTGDIELQGLTLKARNITVDGDNVLAGIDNISFWDKSGFALESMSAKKLSVTSSGISASDLSITSTGSQLNFDKLSLEYQGWRAFSNIADSVRIEASMNNSTIGLRTISYFTNARHDYHTRFDGVYMNLTGPISNISGNISSGTGNSRMSVKFSSRGLPDFRHSLFRADVERLELYADDISYIMADLSGKPISDSLKKTLDEYGVVTLTGHFEGRPDNFTADAQAASLLGEANMDIVIRRDQGQSFDFSGNVEVNDIKLGDILGNRNIGMVTAAAQVRGNVSENNLDAYTDGTVQLAQVGGYDYTDITMRGEFRNRLFSGRILSDDPNVSFSFDGLIDLNDTIPHYDFRMNLAHSDLRKLRINKRDSISLLSGVVAATGGGARLDNLNADIIIDKLQYINQSDTIRTGLVTLTGRNSDENKHIKLRSDFADAEFRSKLSYGQLSDFFRNTLANYLPSWSEPDTVSIAGVRQYEGNATAPGNYSVLNVNIKEANNVAGVFVPGLILAEGSTFSFMFNPYSEDFSLKANSEYIELGNSFASKLEIDGRNVADSIALYLRANEVYYKGFLLPNFSVIGGAKENRLRASMGFADKDRRLSAMIGATAHLNRDTLTNDPDISVRLTPSYMSSGNQTWTIYSRGINVKPSHISVSNLIISGDDQLLRIYGDASRSPSDTLHIELTNFDLNPLSQLTATTGYELSGRANGHADIVSALGSTYLYAGIDFENMKINDVETPPTHFQSVWDFERERARFTITDKTTADTVIRGYYNPANGRYLGDINIPRLDLSLLDVHVVDVLSNTKGTGNLQARISGRGNDLKFNGTLDVKGLSTTIDYTNVRYNFDDVRFTVSDNVIELKGATLRDAEGNPGDVNLSVDLNNLSNVAYSIHLRAHNLLGLNTNELINEQFYGRVYADGTASVVGSKSSINLVANLTTAGASRFYMPLNDKMDMEDADFITFIQPRVQRDTSRYSDRRRNIIGGKRGRNNNWSIPSLTVNLGLTVLPNTYAELLIDPQTGHRIRGRGNGSLNLTVNPSNDIFTLYGDYDITEGTYLFTLENIIEKPFSIEPGSTIQWTGDPVDAFLNISAVYRLRTSISPAVKNSGQEAYSGVRVPLECWITLTDRLSNPNLSFNITAPGATPETQSTLSSFMSTQEMVATQFFFLLATGNLYDYDNVQGNIGEAATASTAFDFLSNHVSNWLSSDTFNIGIRYRPRTDSSSNEFGIDISQQLFGDRILLELEGNYDTQDNSTGYYGNNAKNFTGDFYLTALLDQTGNLKAKVFSRTIDRFDENQGMQESGIGLYYTENFNNFGDIIRNIKERFTGERRRRRLAILEAEKQSKDDADTDSQTESNQ